MATATTPLSYLIFSAIEFDNESVGRVRCTPWDDAESLHFSDEVTVNCDWQSFLFAFESDHELRIPEFDGYLEAIGSCQAGDLTMRAKLTKAAICGDSVWAVFSISVR